MGKTTALHDYIRAHPGHRFFVCDHAGEWGSSSAMWRGQPPAVLVHVTGNLPDELGPGVYVFRDREPLEVAQLAIDVGDVSFVDDELDFCAQQGGWSQNPLRLVVHRGRHLANKAGRICEVHLLGACRRPQNLASDITQIAEQVFIFRCQGELTLRRLYVDEMISEEEFETIRNLPKFSYKHYPSGEFGHIEPL